jgi:hypothetical protein
MAGDSRGIPDIHPKDAWAVSGIAARIAGRRPTFAGPARCQNGRTHASETIVNTTLKLQPRPTNVALIAWQFTGQPLHEWPSWVQSTCSLQRSEDGHLELRHERQSGTQIVYLQEWLVRDLDGGICFYTDAELRKEFDIASSQ